MSNTQTKPVIQQIVSKGLNLLLFLVLLVLGLAGLVLPIIPGLVFLFLALVQLTRLSSRFESIANGSSWFSTSLRRLRALGHLSPFEWTRLGFWVTARGVVGILNTGLRIAGRLLPGSTATGTDNVRQT